VAIDLDGGVGGRHLLDGAQEAWQGLLHELARDVGRGVQDIDGMLEVEARRGGTKLYGGHILLGVGLQLVDALCGTAHAHEHDTRGQRVEGAGMTHLELLDAEALAQLPTHLVDDVERCPAQGFVDAQHESFLRVHQSTIASEWPVHRRMSMAIPTMMRYTPKALKP